MEKNGNYSPAKEEENDTARRDKLGHDKAAEPQTNTAAIFDNAVVVARRNVRGLSVYLFINEDDETE